MKDAVTAPGLFNWNISLFKDIPIHEAIRLQFRAESFNITNTPSFYMDNNVNSGPGTRLGNGSFGQITATDPNYVPRELQFALKLEF